ncbi:MAG: tryptophan-rich sensory protein [Chthoniobacterales bacterium]|nr:tryptophan-rich sensory protein [Chthoniobacterales bacterium]
MLSLFHNIEKKKLFSEILGAFLCLALGIISGYGFQVSDPNWYLSLKKPFFTPPDQVFGPVWTLLYLMMGVVLGNLWREKSKNKTLINLFLWQFFFNLVWSPLFFSFHCVGWALFDLCLLWIVLALFIIKGSAQAKISLLLLPYLGWISFALVLNFWIYLSNA